MTDIHTPRSESVAAADEAARLASESEAGAAETSAGRTAPPPNAGWLRWGWRQLTSMRTALILLFLLALGSIPGSILPQVLLNVPLTITMVTSGAALLFVLWYVTPREMFQPTTGAGQCASSS